MFRVVARSKGEVLMEQGGYTTFESADFSADVVFDYYDALDDASDIVVSVEEYDEC